MAVNVYDAQGALVPLALKRIGRGAGPVKLTFASPFSKVYTRTQTQTHTHTHTHAHTNTYSIRARTVYAHAQHTAK